MTSYETKNIQVWIIKDKVLLLQHIVSNYLTPLGLAVQTMDHREV